MGPNDAEVRSGFTREVGGAISDDTFPSGTQYEVVVEAEAGDAIHGGGGPYAVSMVVRDLTASNTVNTQNLTGNFGDANWPAPPPNTNLAKEFSFTIPAPPAALEGHILEVLASLSVGGVGPLQPPDVSFATSGSYLIHAP